MTIVFKRILLKLSGEALSGDQGFGVEQQAVQKVSNNIKDVVELGCEVAIVIGGGNFLRGAVLHKDGFNQITCDQMGMFATVMNGLILRDGLLSSGVATHLMSAKQINSVAETYDHHLADSYLRNGKVVIFSGGTGAPLFTTDSAAALRGIEINADIILKATKVDGVYSADPKVDASAELFKSLSYQEVLDQELGVMDLTAICLCRDHNKKIRVFNMHKPNVLKDIVLGKEEGTLVSSLDLRRRNVGVKSRLET
ncbi:MAG: UMP kinase [Gammaproteobacteria bacterium]|jgi:uridylate kinase